MEICAGEFCTSNVPDPAGRFSNPVDGSGEWGNDEV